MTITSVDNVMFEAVMQTKMKVVQELWVLVKYSEAHRKEEKPMGK